MYGQASGLVEPIAGVIGAAMVTSMEAILPYALAFAAGAMLYVVVEELIPESQSGGEHESADLSTIGFIIWFCDNDDFRRSFRLSAAEAAFIIK